LCFFDTGFLGQGVGIQAQAKLGFADNVFKEVFDREGHGWGGFLVLGSLCLVLGLFWGLGGSGGGGGFSEVGTLFFGVVRGADEGAGLDYVVPDFEAVFFPVLEFFRCDPAIYGSVLGGGLEILAQGQNVDSGITEVLVGFGQLFGLFTNAEHEAGCGGKASVGGMLQDF